MQAWTRSDAPDKATQTWNLLNGMYNAYQQGYLDMKPAVDGFAAVLNICAYVQQITMSKAKDQRAKPIPFYYNILPSDSR
jgi:hypothetical protein